MTLLSKLFGKKNTETKETDYKKIPKFVSDDFSKKDVGDGFVRTNKAVMVDSELAFKPSIRKTVEGAKKKVLVSNDDYNNLSFDDANDITDYNLSLLSAEAKREIIEIIKADVRKRVYSKDTELARLVTAQSMEFQHETAITVGSATNYDE